MPRREDDALLQTQLSPSEERVRRKNKQLHYKHTQRSERGKQVEQREAKTIMKKRKEKASVVKVE